MPIENEGSPTDWTLRFKHGRITVLLFTEALTPMTTLKAELLSALRERYPNGLPNPALLLGKQRLGSTTNRYIPIPDSIQEIALAMPVDSYDTTKGWKQLKSWGGKEGLKACPKSMGVKDGGVLAFRFHSEDEDGEGQMELDEDEQGKFVVEWPSYEEAYGEAPGP